MQQLAQGSRRALTLAIVVVRQQFQRAALVSGEALHPLRVIGNIGPGEADMRQPRADHVAICAKLDLEAEQVISGGTRLGERLLHRSLPSPRGEVEPPEQPPSRRSQKLAQILEIAPVDDRSDRRRSRRAISRVCGIVRGVAPDAHQAVRPQRSHHLHVDSIIAAQQPLPCNRGDLIAEPEEVGRHRGQHLVINTERYGFDVVPT